MMLELGSTLNPSIADLANFNWVETVPFVIVEVLEKICDEFCANEIKESVAYIAVVLYKKKSTV